MQVILASQSPRRKELLEKLKIPFIVRINQIDEEIYIGEAPDIYAVRMAETKATLVSEENKESLVIGADTIVCLQGEVFGKPADKEDAFRMLKQLSGQKHLVYTAVCLIQQTTGKKVTFIEETEVDVADLTDKEILDYIMTGEPMDKAGSYGIQGEGAIFIKGIKGCFYNVMGLPVHRLYEELKKII